MKIGVTFVKKNLLQVSKFKSSATSRHYPIRQKLSCSSNLLFILQRAINVICNMRVPRQQICPTDEEKILLMGSTFTGIGNKAE